jgi:hypothetical protein
MRYAVIQRQAGETVIFSTHRFAWLARLARRGLLRRGYSGDIDIAQVTQDAEEIIRICDHRDVALLERHLAVETLFGLVARDESGQWTTVHPEDTPIDAEVARLLDRALA